MRAIVACLLVLIAALPAAAAATESPETLLEQQKAREAEERPARRAAGEIALGPSPEGFSALLFIGVDETTVPTWVVDPSDGASEMAFTGFEVWGAAVIPGVSPGDAVVYFNDGADLYRWAHPAAPELCCTLQFSGSDQAMVSAAWDSDAGELLFTRNIATEAVYSLPATAGTCPASCDVTQEIVYAADEYDIGGLAYDASTGTLYGTNDDATPGPAGVYEINGDGTTTLVTAYPVGETDIDGLAVGGGKLYLVTDEPGDISVLDIGTMMYETPIANPWTSSETFSGAGYGAGLIPVELQSFGVD